MIRVEAYRQLRRLRTWIAFGLLAALPTIVAVANKFDRRSQRHRDLAERTFFVVSTHSALNHALAALAFMGPFFLVIVIASFGGESVAGEASWGTLRSLLIRPVPRPKLLASKLAVASLLALAATLTIVVVALGVGAITFGWHDVLTPFLTTVPATQGLVRLALASAYVWWTLGAVLAFAFFLSTLTDSPAGAIGGAFGLSVVSQILDGINSLHAIHPGLPTHYWSAWSSLFTPGIGTSFMVKGAIAAAIWIGVFASLAFWNFRRKDILS